MPTSLTYFDFDASRGLECRLALTVAGVEFEDRRLQRGDWTELKPNVPFGALPVLEVDGKVLAQSSAILRYIGQTHDMHPSDPWIAAEHDALMESVEDLRHNMPGRGMSEEDKKSAREEFAAGFVTQWARTVNDRIVGPFVQGDALNIVDLKLYTILRAYVGGVYDYVPGTLLDPFPRVTALYAAVDTHPAVRAYFAKR